MPPFTSIWGKLKQLQLPSFIFQDGVLALGGAELKVLIVLYYLHLIRFKLRRHDDIVASVKVTQQKLMERTGIKRQATISEAVKSLHDAGFIQIVWDRTGTTKRGAVSSEYLLAVPDTREAVPITPGQQNILGASKMPYFTISRCLLTPTHWLLPKMTQTEVRLYIATLWRAKTDEARDFSFTSTNSKLSKVAGLGSAAFEKALNSLSRSGLIYATRSNRELRIQLCDPFTQEPMHRADEDDENDPANYYAVDADGVTRRFTWSMTEEQCRELVLNSVPVGSPTKTLEDGQVMICCPFHDDSTPSCGISPTKKIFHCLAPTCGAKGKLSALIEKLTGESKGSAIRRIASAMHQTIEFHQPDSKATERYIYKDSNGNPKKLVLRFVDDNGQKTFSQRQWTQNGWVPGTKGLGTLLYHAELVKSAGTVCVVEGEKDADSVTKLELIGRGGLVTIGVTSGSAGSWDSKLAKRFREKVVIVMPDNDVAGEGLAEAVRASLEAQNIQHKTVSFAGTGAKDVSEYLALGNTAEDLVKLIDSDWVNMPDGSHLGEPEELSHDVTLI